MCQRFYHNHHICQGTGSYPKSPPGLHRSIRRIPIIVPRTGPYLAIAWAVYSLHDGVKRHAARAPINGDMHDWYMRTNPIAMRDTVPILFFWCVFIILLFNIIQCAAHGGATIWAGCRQNSVPGQKDIIQPRMHMFFTVPYPVTQQPLCTIAVNRQFKYPLGHHHAVSRIVCNLGRTGAHIKKFAARVYICV